MKIKQALRINEDLHAVEIIDIVFGAGLRIELELVAQARATSAKNAEAQTASLYAHFFKGLTDLLNSLRRDFHPGCGNGRHN